MATITLSPEIYRNMKFYADKRHISVDEYAISLIIHSMPHSPSTHKHIYKMKSTEELSPILQEILAMPRYGSISGDDINADRDREEYLKSKYNIT